MASTTLKKQAQGNNGRWKKSEHSKFMKALEKYGRNWVKVQQMVKTRTLAQVRSHAQKTFLQISEADIDAMIAPSDNQKSEQEIIRYRKKSHRKNQQSQTNKHPVQAVGEEKFSFVKSSNQPCEPQIEENRHKDGKIQRNEQLNTNELMQEMKKSQNSLQKDWRESKNQEEPDCPFMMLFKENQSYILGGGNFINLLFQ